MYKIDNTWGLSKFFGVLGGFFLNCQVKKGFKDPQKL